MKGIVIILLIACIIVGAAIGYFLKPEIDQAAENIVHAVDFSGYVPLDIKIIGTNVRLSAECRAINFDITEDQALSIAKAMNMTSTPRPLPHDVFSDIIENFQIRHIASKIDRYEDRIYMAHMIFQSSNNVLEIDARPSDTIAISLRTGTKVYMDRKILEETGEKTC
ncbi:MAG TPA: bifunctional nuclease domain-containing protein [archaeon]|nr:bifunctional nuclease domain-containing protein [archaeon]